MPFHSSSRFLLLPLLVFLSSAYDAIAVTQCPDETTAGCTSPPWNVSYAMRLSTYTYCFGECPVPWLIQNSQPGVYGGVIGVDHYYTHQGMPCIDGIPQEFEMQNNFTIQTKQVFPDVRILQYRITSAVPYAKVVHDAMLSNPEYFVSWIHGNGSMCQMPYEEHGTTNQSCAWPIIASAYNWSNPDTQVWFLENIIHPVMEYADGAWIDGDGPDNGAWMCSGSYNYNNLPAPYPALNPDDITAFCTGEANVTKTAQEWLIANKGYDYNCFNFLSGSSSLPVKTDNATVCGNKIRHLDHYPTDTAIVLYGDRTNTMYDDSTALEAVSIFLLVRGDYWFLSFPEQNTLNSTTAELLLSDYGVPLGNMTDNGNNVFTRQYQLATVSMDCNTFTGKIVHT